MCSIRDLTEFMVDPYYEPLLWFMIIRSIVSHQEKQMLSCNLHYSVDIYSLYLDHLLNGKLAEFSLLF